LAGEAVRSVPAVTEAAGGANWSAILDAHPRLAPALRWLDDQIDLPELAQGAASWLTGAAGSFVRASLEGTVTVLLTFYFLFYLLRDAEAARHAVESLLPLERTEFMLLAQRITDTIYATVYGTIAVATLQGVLGGAMFWFLGLPAPVLWGLLMAILAVFPFLGAFVVWAPAAAYLAMRGEWPSAALLTGWGVVVVGTVDNLVYPILVGQRLKLHTVPSFIAIAGGIILFGVPGVILGPVTVTTCLILLEIVRRRGLASLQ
jgi:predicted PurR-regulated permease PerM